MSEPIEVYEAVGNVIEGRTFGVAMGVLHYWAAVLLVRTFPPHERLPALAEFDRLLRKRVQQIEDDLNAGRLH